MGDYYLLYSIKHFITSVECSYIYKYTDEDEEKQSGNKEGCKTRQGNEGEKCG